jgi:hypothetical protein
MFNNQKPFKVTSDFLKPSAFADDFKCCFCSYTFKLNDTARWLYTNSEPAEDCIAGNPFVCTTCDGPREKLLLKLKEMSHIARTKYWYFSRSFSYFWYLDGKSNCVGSPSIELYDHSKRFWIATKQITNTTKIVLVSYMKHTD